MGAGLAIGLLLWIGAHIIGFLLIGAAPILLTLYLIERKLWWWTGALLIALLSLPIIASVVNHRIKNDFAEQCAAVAKTRINVSRRLTTDTIYISIQRDANSFNDGYLDIDEARLNNTDIGFKYIETNKQFSGAAYTRFSYNGNRYEPTDEITSWLELNQKISRHSTNRFFSIDKSAFVLRNRQTGEVIAEHTVLALNPNDSPWVLVQSLVVPSRMYCGDDPSQGLPAYPYGLAVAWGERALAFVRRAVDPISEHSNQSNRAPIAPFQR
jgi:hypothetical protein